MSSRVGGDRNLQGEFLMSAWLKGVGAALAAHIALSASQPAFAQDQQSQPQPQEQSSAQPPSQQQVLTQQQIQQLVAPIALYPDALLAQVLTASTYPLEVAMAARWSEKNQNLKGTALEDAMQKEQWDPSVKGLTSVPQVLAMMNEKLDWTNQLGEAFLAQPNDIQIGVQALRKQAEVTGSLKSSKEQKVGKIPAPATASYAGPPEYITIEPTEPDYIYVPVYDPVVVYGPDYWPPAYAPFFWYPRWWAVGPAFGFGAALFVGPALWYHYSWGHPGYAAIQTNTVLYSRFNRVSAPGGGQFQSWRFDPVHHGNVPFRNANLQRQFGNVSARSVQGTQAGRNVQGIQTGNRMQGTGSGTASQGLETGKVNSATQTDKSTQSVRSIQANKSTQGIQNSKNVQTIQASHVQEAQSGRRVQTNNRPQFARTGGGGQGGSKGKGKGKGQK